MAERSEGGVGRPQALYCIDTFVEADLEVRLAARIVEADLQVRLNARAAPALSV